jgi:hypothetical protein
MLDRLQTHIHEVLSVLVYADSMVIGSISFSDAIHDL